MYLGTWNLWKLCWELGKCDEIGRLLSSLFFSSLLFSSRLVSSRPVPSRPVSSLLFCSLYLNLARETGSALCQIAPWDCFGDVIASLFGYYEVAPKTGSKGVPQNSPIIQFESTSAQLHEPIGYLHDDVILLLRPESFRVFLSCVN